MFYHSSHITLDKRQQSPLPISAHFIGPSFAGLDLQGAVGDAAVAVAEPEVVALVPSLSSRAAPDC